VIEVSKVDGKYYDKVKKRSFQQLIDGITNGEEDPPRRAPSVWRRSSQQPTLSGRAIESFDGKSSSVTEPL
jgi:hypothetical protein